MNTRMVWLAALLVPLFTAGCASTGDGPWYNDWKTCALAGGVLGGGAGSIEDSEAAAVGAAAGAVIGGVICALLHEDEPPPDPDSDGDGVPDSRDRCPGTPVGAKVDEHGCEFDSDGDGVVDSQDRCPNTPAGAKVDAYGCELDSDGDGVVDGKDLCPATPTGTEVDAVGCPAKQDIVLEGVNFKHDSAQLLPESTAILGNVARTLVRHPNLKVEVEGHTDSQGAAAYNQNLSERRANSVRTYLISLSVKPGNLKAIGFGEEQPIADNSTREGRAQNRRVELHIVD